MTCQGSNLQHGGKYSQAAFVELCGRLRRRSGFDLNPTVAEVGLWGVPAVVVGWGVRPDTPCNARPALRERIRSALLPNLILVILSYHPLLSYFIRHNRHNPHTPAICIVSFNGHCQLLNGKDIKNECGFVVRSASTSCYTWLGQR